MKEHLKTAKQIWDKLGDIPTDEEENLDEDFHTLYRGVVFEKGTNKYEVWHWFEEVFNISVAIDLMGLE